MLDPERSRTTARKKCDEYKCDHRVGCTVESRKQMQITRPLLATLCGGHIRPFRSPIWRYPTEDLFERLEISLFPSCVRGAARVEIETFFDSFIRGLD